MLLGFPVPAWIGAGIFLAAFYILMSIRRVGPAEVGLVLKRVSFRKLARTMPSPLTASLVTKPIF